MGVLEEIPKKKWKGLVKKAEESLRANSTGLITYLEEKRFAFQLEHGNDLTIVIDEDKTEPVLLVWKGTGLIAPSLQMLRRFPDTLPKIWVDTGAVKPLLNGANLFRQGITKFEEFEKGQLVQILNPQGNVLSLAESLFSSEDMPTKGQVMKTLSFLNDEIWRAAEKIKKDE